MRGGKSTARIWPDAGRTGSSRRGRMAGKRLVLLGRPRMPSPDRDATRPLTRRRFCALFLPACPYMAFPSPTPFNIVPGSGSLAQTRRALNHPPSVRRRPAPAAPCPARPTPPAPAQPSPSPRPRRRRHPATASSNPPSPPRPRDRATTHPLLKRGAAKTSFPRAVTATRQPPSRPRQRRSPPASAVHFGTRLPRRIRSTDTTLRAVGATGAS